MNDELKEEIQTLIHNLRRSAEDSKIPYSDMAMRSIVDLENFIFNTIDRKEKNF